MSAPAYELERQDMVQIQIAKRGIREPRVLEAFKTVPRHDFVSAELRFEAYDDCPLPIGYGQTISQPYIVALMTSSLRLQGSERVLEIGTGSGYQAAILSTLAQEVHTVEVLPELAERSRDILNSYENVHCHLGDGSLGWEAAAPYDGILVAAAAPQIPAPLLKQLAEGGRLVIPVGGRSFQKLELWEKYGKDFSTESIVNVAFVPLRGERGWDRKVW